jgi:hypothetical protein
MSPVPSLSDDAATTSKKRKLSDKDPAPGLAASVVEVAHHGGEKEEKMVKKYLKEQEKRLDVQSKLHDKEKAINEMKQKQKERDILHAAALEVVKSELRRSHQDTLVVEGKNVDLRTMITQRDKTINQLELDKMELMEENFKLKADIRHLEQLASRGRRPAPHQPTLAPDPDPKVRNHEEYEHPQAPRENATYRYFTHTLPYASGQGKVWPSRYGSNGRWDLGLCQVHFNTPDRCHCGDRCEYRHHPLTLHERIYITELQPSGSRFLDRSDYYLRTKAAGNVD